MDLEDLGEIMGVIIVKFEGMKPRISIERRVDDIETQKLSFGHGHDSWLSTETGGSLSLFGRDDNYNTMEVYIPISVKDLSDALNEYLKHHME